jgi:hypothetical protein
MILSGSAEYTGTSHRLHVVRCQCRSNSITFKNDETPCGALLWFVPGWQSNPYRLLWKLHLRVSMHVLGRSAPSRYVEQVCCAQHTLSNLCPSHNGVYGSHALRCVAILHHSLSNEARHLARARHLVRGHSFTKIGGSV